MRTYAQNLAAAGDPYAALWGWYSDRQADASKGLMYVDRNGLAFDGHIDAWPELECDLVIDYSRSVVSQVLAYEIGARRDNRWWDYIFAVYRCLNEGEINGQV